ncbi:putative metal-binding protein [Limihaloglobus sulfuriphilus]|uniref:Putative metal-binding protein n=1 Tax=Limihaloglobus sulfuriphilus TaxID=1851148 RepID=A0A1Q2MD89_9BACT|nr:DUF2284 domain-containing protein [Limihaloglobus sulfuriphilus]AQQ70666.1 putative metal-binding protein [Limihaloglobus sulfuriphilus]
MEDKLKYLISKALESGAASAGIISPGDIRFDKGFRLACEQNSCGQYGTNWMCPPAVGPLEDLIPRVKEYSKGVVFQTVYQLEDSFDFEGMMKAADVHRDVLNVFMIIYLNMMNTDRCFRSTRGHVKSVMNAPILRASRAVFRKRQLLP